MASCSDQRGVLGTESSGEDALRPGPLTHAIGSLLPPLYGRQRPRGVGPPAQVRKMNVNPTGTGWTWVSSPQPDTTAEWPPAAACPAPCPAGQPRKLGGVGPSVVPWPTLCNPRVCPWGSPGEHKASTLERVATPFSRELMYH